MPMLTVGALSIPYNLTRSDKAQRARITVTPHHVDLVVPTSAKKEQIEDVLSRKRYWIVEHHQRMMEKLAQAHRIHRYASGAKIPYRGRMARLSIRPGTDSLVQVHFRNELHVEVPPDTNPSERDALIESALRLWLKKQIRQDAHALAKRYSERLQARARAVRVKEQKHMWGSCGKDRVINLNWQLVFAPKQVLEYAVLHEMAHLVQRDHSPAFWRLVRSHMPDYEQRKTWLESNEHMLGYKHVPIVD